MWAFQRLYDRQTNKKYIKFALGGFRRARRAKSEQYLSIIKQAEDVAQYKERQKTLDKLEMPETLDEFLDLKYNKKKNLSFLKASRNINPNIPTQVEKSMK